MKYKILKLKEVAEIITGNTPSKKESEYWDDGDIPFITPSELSFDYVGFVNEYKQYITQKGTEKARMLPENTVMVCCIGSLGKIGISREKVVTNQQINSLVFDQNKVYYKYGAYVVSTIRELMENIAPSTTVKIINKSIFSDMTIPIPPLDTQRKIVDVLDKTQELIEKRREQIEKLDDFIQSVFLDMFGDSVNNTKNWTTAKLDNVLISIESGWSPKCENTPAHLNEWGVLKLSAVTGGKYKYNENKALLDTSNPKPQLEVKKGDLLFTRKNTFDLVGSCAYVFKTQPNLMIADTIFRINTTDAVDKQYLWGLFNDDNFKKRIQKLASGTSGSMPNISKAKLKELNIPLPPIKLQNKFATIVEKTEQQKKLFQKSLTEMENNFNSLMQKAFKGELF